MPCRYSHRILSDLCLLDYRFFFYLHLLHFFRSIHQFYINNISLVLVSFLIFCLHHFTLFSSPARATSSFSFSRSFVMRESSSSPLDKDHFWTPASGSMLTTRWRLGAESLTQQDRDWITWREWPLPMLSLPSLCSLSPASNLVCRPDLPVSFSLLCCWRLVADFLQG